MDDGERRGHDATDQEPAKEERGHDPGVRLCGTIDFGDQHNESACSAIVRLVRRRHDEVDPSGSSSATL